MWCNIHTKLAKLGFEMHVARLEQIRVIKVGPMVYKEALDDFTLK
jgi:hypothetical protein